ncbi:alpha-2,8-polysialyltransferase family protein [Amylibacter sp.]|nr:alpha-2,8-polysialyltransferase family protein [Amylibacter sp.]
MCDSPFQLLCAIERSQQLNANEKSTTLVYLEKVASSSATKKLIKNIMRQNYFNQQYYILRRTNNVYVTELKIAIFTWFVSYKWKVDNLYIGDCRWRHFIWFMSAFIEVKVWLLDDGLHTTSHYQHLDSKQMFLIQDGSSSKLSELFYIFFPRLRRSFGKKYNFSYFSLFQPPDGCIWVKNELNFLKQLVEVFCFEDVGADYIIIGQPLSELGVITLNTELDLLETVVTETPRGEIVYIRHRSDSEEKLQSINDIVAVKELPYPLEILWLDPVMSGKKLVGFYSTALITANILGSEIEVNYIKLKNTDDKKVDEIYDYIESQKFNKFLEFDVLSGLFVE